jgi:hypothetical protein
MAIEKFTINVSDALLADPRGFTPARFQCSPDCPVILRLIKATLGVHDMGHVSSPA